MEVILIIRVLFAERPIGFDGKEVRVVVYGILFILKLGPQFALIRW